MFSVLCCLLLTKPLIPISCLRSLPLCHFAAFTAKEGSQRAGKICYPFIVFPEGNQNIKQAILQDRGKKERKKKKNTKTLKVPADGVLGQNPTTRGWRPKCLLIMPVLQNLRNCYEPHGVCGYWQAAPLIKCNLQQTKASPERWYLSSFTEDWLGLLTILKGNTKGNQEQT